jgi:dTDP-4-dehydrorhamnose 3,5-epimerase
MPEFRETALPGVIEIIPDRHTDARGYFSETWNRAHFAEAGIDLDFVQDNHSYSKHRGVLRGLHYQLAPFAQDKLVRVVRGRVFDVAVDIRKGSPHYGQWVGVELSADKGNQLLVPRGFAHGFLTLEPETEFLYKVTNPYSRECDRSIRFDDPAIGIDWPIDHADVILTAKDRDAPLLAAADNNFNVLD